MILSFIKCWHWEDLRTLSAADKVRPLLIHILSLPLSLSFLICSPPAHPLFLSLARFISFVFLLCLLRNPNTFRVKRSSSLALDTTKKTRCWDLLGWPICVFHLSSLYSIIKAMDATHHQNNSWTERLSREKGPLDMSYLWTFKTILTMTRTELR